MANAGLPDADVWASTVTDPSWNICISKLVSGSAFSMFSAVGVITVFFVGETVETVQVVHDEEAVLTVACCECVLLECCKAAIALTRFRARLFCAIAALEFVRLRGSMLPDIVEGEIQLKPSASDVVVGV